MLLLQEISYRLDMETKITFDPTEPEEKYLYLLGPNNHEILIGDLVKTLEALKSFVWCDCGLARWCIDHSHMRVNSHMGNSHRDDSQLILILFLYATRSKKHVDIFDAKLKIEW